MIDYWFQNQQSLFQATFEHLQIVFLSLSLSLVLAISIIILLNNYPKILNALIYVFSAMYSIPSFAFFALLIPLTGLGTTTAVIVLTLYSEYILLRSFISGLAEVDPTLIEASKGMGMTSKQIFYKIQVPLAMKSIFTGIRIALTSIIGVATIASTINAGGLGRILFEGLRMQNVFAILWGAALTVLLCVFVTAVLSGIEKITLSKFNLQ